MFDELLGFARLQAQAVGRARDQFGPAHLSLFVAQFRAAAQHGVVQEEGQVARGAAVALAVGHEALRQLVRVGGGAGGEQQVHVGHAGAGVVHQAEDHHRMRVVEIASVGQHRDLLDLDAVAQALVRGVFGGEGQAQGVVAGVVLHAQAAQHGLHGGVRAAVVAHAAHDSHVGAAVRGAGHDLEGAGRRLRMRHLHQLAQALARRRQRFARGQHVLRQHQVVAVEVGRGQPHHAVAAGFAGVAVDVVVELAVDGVAGQHEGKDRVRAFGELELRVVVDPAQRQGQRLRTAQLQPVQHALARFDAVEPGLDRAQPALAQLRQRGAEVGRRQHDQVAHRAGLERLALYVVAIEPFAHHRAAGAVGDAGEAAFSAGFGQHLGDGVVEGAGDVGHGDFVAEADVLAQVHVGDVEARAAGLRGLGLQAGGQFAIGRRAGDGPAVDEYEQELGHAGLGSGGGRGRRDRRRPSIPNAGGAANGPRGFRPGWWARCRFRPPAVRPAGAWAPGWRRAGARCGRKLRRARRASS